MAVRLAKLDRFPGSNLYVFAYFWFMQFFVFCKFWEKSAEQNSLSHGFGLFHALKKFLQVKSPILNVFKTKKEKTMFGHGDMI